MDRIDDEDDSNKDNDEVDKSVVDNDEEDEVDVELDLESQDIKDIVIRSAILFVFIIKVYN